MGSKDKCDHEIDIDNVDVSLEGDIMTLDYNAYSCDSSFTSKVQINYCPICGENLTKEKG